jgi:hypothetical protein
VRVLMKRCCVPTRTPSSRTKAGPTTTPALTGIPFFSFTQAVVYTFMVEVLVALLYAAMVCAFYFVGPMIGLIWLVRGARIGSKQLGPVKYDSIEELTDDVIARTGLTSTIVVKASRLDKLRIEGALPETRRRASVSFFGTPSLRWQTNYARFQVDVDRAVKVSFSRRTFGEGFQLGTNDQVRVFRAFRNNPELRATIEELFRTTTVDQVLVWDGKVTATAKLASLDPARYREVLALLERIARAFDPVRLNVRVLGGERRALAGATGDARCAYCHAHVTGEEPDLIACALCGTVLHDACWEELRRCPVLGCPGVKVERGTDRARTTP